MRTVLGDIEPSQLGVTDYHEHLFQSTPLLPGDSLDDEVASTTEARALVQAGAAAMVEATPLGLGRRPSAVARASAATGLHVVHTSGAHREAHYGAGHAMLTEDDAGLRGRFTRDLFVGMTDDNDEWANTPGGSPVLAGLLKVGIGYWAITAFERRVADVVAQISAETGVPVMVHLEHGSAAHEILDLLAGHGCGPDRVALAHVDRNPDPGLLVELAARGAFLGFDGPGRHQRWPDSTILTCMATVIAAGRGSHLLLGGDVARRSRYRAYGGMPGLQYLFDRFVPRLRREVGQRATTAILVENPARWLAWSPAARP